MDGQVWDRKDGISAWRTHCVDTKAGRIHWRQQGPDAGPPLVFVHGILVNGRLWDEVAHHLAGHACCVVPDWPLGAHPAPMKPDADLSVSGMVELIREFVDRLGRGPVILVGSDSGGALIQIFATRHPEHVRALVLTPCDAYGTWLPLLFKPLEMAAFVPGALWLLATLLRWRRLRRLPFAFGWLARRLSDELSDRFVLPWARSRQLRRDVGKFLRDLGPRHTLKAAAAFVRIRVPVLIVWAAQDRLFPAALALQLARDLPQATLHWIENAYTFVALDRPDELADAIGRFLRRNGWCEAPGT